jgi:hypothetical protein
MSVSISAAANPTSKEITTLTEVDPFADVADTAEDQGFDAPPPEAPKKVPAKKPVVKPAVSTDADGKVTMTLKGGSGFDAPWVVIHAADIPDAYEQLSGDNAALLVEVMNKVAKASKYFNGLYLVGTDTNGNIQTSAGPRQGAPRQSQQPPAGAPECPPGWEFKSGVSKNTGKPWKGFFPPRGSDEKPLFFN